MLDLTLQNKFWWLTNKCADCPWAKENNCQWLNKENSVEWVDCKEYRKGLL